MRWCRVSGLRPVAAPFVAAAPAGARVRTRLRVSPQDEAVLWAAGTHLGSLAGRDLAARCAEGRLDAKGKAGSRAVRKRALTAESSSRWAGAITRTSEDQWSLAERNLRAGQASLQARIRRIQARLAVPAGGKSGRTRGYATAAERHAKAIRLRSLQARLARADRRLAAGTVSVVRGGRALLRKRANLAAGLEEDRWRAEWESARLFLTADGEKDKPLGNETIRWHPGEGWLEIKLPAPLAHLANRPHGRYRLSCGVGFSYRGDEVAAQTATGAVRYDISHDPASRPLVPRRVLEDLCCPGSDAGRAPGKSGDGGRRQRRAPGRRGRRGRRQRPGHPRRHPAGPGRAARRHPGRAAAGRHHRSHRHRERARRPRDRDRGPGLRRGQVPGTRAPREPPLPRPAGPGLPAAGGRHPRPGSSAAG